MIVGRGNVGHKMFFIHKGVIEVCVHNRSTVYTYYILCVLCVLYVLCILHVLCALYTYIGPCTHIECNSTVVGFQQVLDGSDRIATLSDGDVIGEVNLVYSVIHKATVRAVTHCDLLVLTRSDLMQILTVFPGGK